jgi:hypothetical protein
MKRDGNLQNFNVVGCWQTDHCVTAHAKSSFVTDKMHGHASVARGFSNVSSYLSISTSFLTQFKLTILGRRICSLIAVIAESSAICISFLFPSEALSPSSKTGCTLKFRNKVAMTTTNSTCANFCSGQLRGPSQGMNVATRSSISASSTNPLNLNGEVSTSVRGAKSRNLNP